MKPNDFPKEIRPFLMPFHQGDQEYRCLKCRKTFGIQRLHYTCPDCGAVLLIHDRNFDALQQIDGPTWRRIFDYRGMLNIPALKGVFRYHELIAPQISMEAVLYLGEGHTPIVEANAALRKVVGRRFFFKNDGQNPSASFKDRGMAVALSHINAMVQQGHADEVLAICASTGDTSAAAALYAAYLSPNIKSAVLLPRGKVTPQQLSQPLGSGASVFEIPGVFDDCMKVVEALSEHYNVALLNSKNAWRILGQESYSFEIAQALDYDTDNLVVVVPIGNAGNITAVMSGFLKLEALGVISALPKIIGVQSEHADPVYRYYREPDPAKRRFEPVAVRPSVAQAAMIGNPVSMPRVIRLAEDYDQRAGTTAVYFEQVSEQAIMQWQLTANRNGHIACTHGGECLAGLITAIDSGVVSDSEFAVLDSTAHQLKFSGFQQMYFDKQLPEAYQVEPDDRLINHPQLVRPSSVKAYPEDGRPLGEEEMSQFVNGVSAEIARRLALKRQ